MAEQALPKQRPNLVVREVEGEMVVLDKDADLVHKMNPTAAFIWSHCDGQSAASDIAAKLAKAFEVDSEVAHADVEATLAQFAELALLDTP